MKQLKILKSETTEELELKYARFTETLRGPITHVQFQGIDLGDKEVEVVVEEKENRRSGEIKQFIQQPDLQYVLLVFYDPPR